VSHEGYSITTDRERLDVDAIFDYLSQHAYWAKGRSRETVERSIAGSLCFGLFHGDAQIGFGRVITDYATFSYLCDVYVLEEYRGRGLGRWLIDTMIAHPALGPSVRLFLRTRDAQELYRRVGFDTISNPESYMVRPPRP
jgi:ribosomal protein S18 acetylase RimI-like enzyme